MKTIMLVEDEESSRSALTALLKAHDFHVVACFDGSDALDKLVTGKRPDAILLDYDMPLMGAVGFRAAQRAMGLHVELPVVLMSAGGNLEAKASQVSADAWLPKPLDVPNLLRALEHLTRTP